MRTGLTWAERCRLLASCCALSFRHHYLLQVEPYAGEAVMPDYHHGAHRQRDLADEDVSEHRAAPLAHAKFPC